LLRIVKGDLVGMGSNTQAGSDKVCGDMNKISQVRAIV